MRRALPIAILLVALAALAAPSPASAEKREREGWLVGVALGAGGVKYKHVDFQRDGAGGASFQLTFGGMMKRRLALVASLELVVANDRNGGNEQSLVATTVGVRWFALDMLWLQGGVGSGSYSYHESETGLDHRVGGGRSLSLAAGVDVLQSGKFGLSGELHTTITDFGDQGAITYSLVVGLTWY